MQNLTVDQLRKAMQENPYLMVRDGDFTYAVNSKVANLPKMKGAEGSTVTNISGYYPINFQEYISNKTNFL